MSKSPGVTYSEIHMAIKANLKLDDDKFKESIEEMVNKFGLNQLQEWKDTSNKHGNHLVHILASQGKLKSFEALSKLGFDINLQREFDQNTPLHCASWACPEIAASLIALGCDKTVQNRYNEVAETLMNSKLALNELTSSLQQLFALDDAGFKKEILGLVNKFGIKALKEWDDNGKHRNKLAHVLVIQNKLESLKYLSTLGLDLDVQRSSDLNTALHCAAWGNSDAIPFLMTLGCDTTIVNKYGETAVKLSVTRNSMNNIIFLDLELTCLPSAGVPKILECAVVITDGDLVEIDRANWVIHFEQEELNSLSDWHKRTFASISNQGNGLFDACVSSSLTHSDFETQILDFLTKYCPPKACPLGGFSVHCDREILFQCSRKLYDFVSHQVIDVSTLLSLCRRFNPSLYKKREEEDVQKSNPMLHRGMVDVDESIKALRWCRSNFLIVPK